MLTRERVEIINCRAERGREGYIIVSESGRITYRSEADGYKVCHRGLEPHEETLTLDTMRAHPYARDYIYTVQAVLRRFGCTCELANPI